MAEIGGSWEVLYGWTTITPGTWTVSGWALCRVTINHITVDDLMSCKNSKKTKQGSGTCELVCADPNRLQTALFHEGDEIVIYMQDEEVANKVWGGYLETKIEQDVKGKQLKISGNEYSSRLNNQTFTGTYSGTDLADIVTDIMSNQSDFTTTNVPSVTGILTDATFTNETMFKALKKLADENNYTFWIDLDKDLHFESTSIVRYSTNTVEGNVNSTRDRAVETNKLYLTNKVTVAGTTAEATSEDATSQTTYGVNSRKVTVAGLNSLAAVTRYADEYIESEKNPKTQQVTLNTFLDDVLPKYFISVTIADIGFSGYYQIVEVTHNYGLGIGLNTVLVLGNSIDDTSDQLGVFERRIQDLETSTF